MADTQSTMSMSNIEIAETYVEAFRCKDASKARLAEDVTLQFPLAPRKITGKESVIDYMVAIFPGIDGVKVERHMTGGEYVATLWMLLSVWGEIPICSVFRISDGAIREIRSFWDPRPLLQRRDAAH